MYDKITKPILKNSKKVDVELTEPFLKNYKKVDDRPTDRQTDIQDLRIYATRRRIKMHVVDLFLEGYLRIIIHM